MKISDRTKSILSTGFSVLVIDFVFNREWEPALIGVTLFVVVALFGPYLVTFMSDADDLNRRN